MKKYIKFKLLIFIAFLAITAVSCNENDEPEPIISTEGYPVATFAVSNTTVNEKDGLVTITITTDKMLTRGITFSAEQIGGTAVLHDDYDIVEATVAPFTNVATLLVKFYGDDVAEAAKTLKLQITTPSLANRYLLNPTTVLPSYNITINNFVANYLDVSFDWNKNITIGGTAYPTCGNIDLDIIVGTAAGFDISDPWTYDVGFYDGATGDCPETFTIALDEWDDGEYVIFHDLWSNEFATEGANTLVPIVATFTRPGVFTKVVTQANSQSMNSNNTSHNGIVAKFKIANGIFTISDYAGTVLVSGKTSTKIRTSRPLNIRK